MKTLKKLGLLDAYVSLCICTTNRSDIMSTPKNLPWEPAKIGTKSFIEDIYYDEVDAYEMEDIIESLENPLDTRHTV